jgi:UDP-glucuronate 4-epimerase
MDGAKILVTGPTGQVATPVTLALAKANEVWGAARFRDEAARQRLEAAGVNCVPVDLVAGEFDGLPTDFDYVLNLAVSKSNRWDIDLAVNAESVGLLMAHCRTATAFLHCSSTAVYDPPDDDPRLESASLGDNHKVLFETYSIAKIAGEVVVRTMARHLGLPTTIARLNVPYGDNGGWPYFHLEMMLGGMAIPVPVGRPARYNPIHEDDIIAQVPKLLAAASVPATTVNWGGDESVELQEWCTYLGSLVGREPQFVETDQTLFGVPVDLTRMHELIGGTTVGWREGMRRLAASFHPELVAAVD